MGQSWEKLVKKHARLKAGLKSALPRANFITIHYVYFAGLCLASSVIFWASSDPSFSISYVDSLFLVVAAMTEAGLNTVNLSEMNTWQQVILCLLIVLGSTIWVSIWTVLARKHVFERRFKRIVRAGRLRPRRSHVQQQLEKIQSAPGDVMRREPSHAKSTLMDSLAGRPRTSIAAVGQSTSTSFSPAINVTELGREPADSTREVETAGRNGRFHDLTREEREQLGGCEYRALRLLAIVVPLYFVLWHLLGCLALGAWIANNLPEPAVANGVNPWWLGIFNGVSAFNNSGMTPLDSNMVPFQNSSFVLITIGLMILAGNTAYPVFLRFILWSGLKILNWATQEGDFVEWKETLEFILKYPRRVYTNLFPARHTWWLLFMVLLLTCIDWVGFELLNLGNPAVESIPLGFRILDGLFQAIAVRSGGFSVVPISNMYIGLQILYVIMMYISVYPVVITMRHSNVYEERSLGIHVDEMEAAAESSISFLSQQVHGQLAHDVWWLVLAVFLISTIETANFLADPISYSVFNIVFEVVSAYGCVGISVGLPTASYSFSGGWHSASKVILCLVMIRGRHRGLPVALDRAVRLPGEDLFQDEEEDHRNRRNLTMRKVSMND